MDYHPFKTTKGLNRSIVTEISEKKNEPGWMTDYRLKALAVYEQLPLPSWGADLSELPLHDLHYYLRPLEQQQKSWDTVPASIKKTFEKLGIPQAEREMLAGVGAQFESEMIYKSLKKEWHNKGVIFCDLSQGLQNYPELFKQYFSTIIPAHDNKFAALNAAVWSGGSFIYVPERVIIDKPLQAYFRIEAAQMGQFERTLIIADKHSSVHYVEGCSAPLYPTSSLHSAVVEIAALAHSNVQYTTIQNWSPNIYNLVTKRAVAYTGARVAWVDGNFGSKVTMKYPAVILKEPYAQAEIISIAVAGKGQHQDTGAKIIHAAPYTSSSIIAKSISKEGGRSSYRGLLKVTPHAHESKASVACDALLFDAASRSDTYPTLTIAHNAVDIAHEATVSSLQEEDLFYCMSRGFTKSSAQALIVNGFIEPFVSLLPMEYAIELNKLIALEMEDSIG
jgi:Fe-S cluster assembly protein SufB